MIYNYAVITIPLCRQGFQTPSTPDSCGKRSHNLTVPGREMLWDSPRYAGSSPLEDESRLGSDRLIFPILTLRIGRIDSINRQGCHLLKHPEKLLSTAFQRVDAAYGQFSKHQQDRWAQPLGTSNP